MALFAFASIFFLFGSMVVAESGSGSSENGAATQINGTLAFDAKEIKLAKKFQIESEAIAKARIEARAIPVRPVAPMPFIAKETLPAWIEGDAKDALEAFDLDRVTLEKLKRLSQVEREKVLSEIKLKVKSKNTEIEARQRVIKNRNKEISDAYKLQGNARLLERLRIAVEIANKLEGNAALKEKLSTLYAALKDKTVLTADEKKQIEDALWELRKVDFVSKAPGAISLAQRVDSRLVDFISRLEALISKRTTDGLNTSRLTAGLNQLKKVETKLSEQIAVTQDDWDAYVANPSRDTLKAVHFDLVKLKVLARHALQRMHVMVRFYKHFNDNNGKDDADLQSYESALVSETQSDSSLEAEATATATVVVGAVDEVSTNADTAITSDDNPSSDDVAEETNGGDVE